MELNKSYVFEVKTLRKRKNIQPWPRSFDSSFSLKGKKIGSAFPRSSISRRRTLSLIKPPSIIAANPILKAADQIDKQTASIPWEDLSSTLHHSKSNFSRLKEIRCPVRFCKEFDENPAKHGKNIEKPLLRRSELHSKANSRDTESQSAVFRIVSNSKSSTLVNFNKNPSTEFEQASLVSYESPELQGNQRTDTFLPKYYKSPSFHIIKLKRAKVLTKYNSKNSITSTLKPSFRKAPFSTSLKGKKLLNRNSSQSVLTPNHFLNK